jgi:hypothetical protein
VGDIGRLLKKAARAEVERPNAVELVAVPGKDDNSGWRGSPRERPKELEAAFDPALWNQR